MAAAGSWPSSSSSDRSGEALKSERAMRQSLERMLEESQERYDRLAERWYDREIRFEGDCRDYAEEEAGAHSACFLRRGHLIVDDRLLAEHWWVTSGERIIDPTLVGARGVSRKSNSFEYLALDPEGADFDFSGPPPVCMRTWGKCQTKPVCDWCQARAFILEERPNLVPAVLTIGFEPAEKKPGPFGRDLDL